MLPCEQPGFDSPSSSYKQICQSPRAVRPTQLFILPMFRKWVPSNTGANPWSSTRVALADHHWWYDRPLGNYDPGSLGHAHADWSMESYGSRRIVSLVSFLICVTGIMRPHLFIIYSYIIYSWHNTAEKFSFTWKIVK